MGKVSEVFSFLKKSQFNEFEASFADGLRGCQVRPESRRDKLYAALGL